jgi:hypothetical protein
MGCCTCAVTTIKHEQADDKERPHLPPGAPAHVREFLLPRLKRMGDLVHQAGALVFHHDDGAIRPMIPDLIAARCRHPQSHPMALQRHGARRAEARLRAAREGLAGAPAELRATLEQPLDDCAAHARMIRETLMKWSVSGAQSFLAASHRRLTIHG